MLTVNLMIAFEAAGLNARSAWRSVEIRDGYFVDRNKVNEPTSLYDVLGNLGIPPCEVGPVRLLENTAPVDPDSLVTGGETFVVEAAPSRTLETPRFLGDLHLGRLVRYLRVLGFDTAWEVSGEEAFILEKKRFEFTDVAEGFFVSEHAGGIDGLGVVKAEEVAVVANSFRGIFGITDGAVLVTPTARDVEAFECKAGGIEFGVAGIAGNGAAVEVELFADRGGSAGVRFDCCDPGGRRGNVEAEEAFNNPYSAQDRRSRGAIGGDTQNAGLGEESAAWGVFWELDKAWLDALENRESVVLGEAFVKEGEVGVDEIADGEIFLNEVGEKEACFAEGGLGEEVIEIVVRVEFGVGRVGVDLAEIEPGIEKGIDESFGTRVI